MSQYYFDRTFVPPIGYLATFSGIEAGSGKEVRTTGTIFTATHSLQFSHFRLDSLGYPISGMALGTASFDSLHFALPMSGGGSLLVGKTLVRGEVDILMIWVDSLGNERRHQLIDWGDDDIALCGRFLPDGGILLGGRVEDVGAGGNDGFVMKLDSLGIPLLGRTIGFSQSDEVVDLLWQNNLVVVVGNIRGAFSPSDTMPDIFMKGFYLSNLSPIGNKTLMMGQPNYPDRVSSIVSLGPAGYRLAGVGGEWGSFLFPARGQLYAISNQFGLTQAIEVWTNPVQGILSQLGFYRLKSNPGGSIEVLGAYQDITQRNIALSSWSLGLNNLGGNKLLGNIAAGSATLGSAWNIGAGGDWLIAKLESTGGLLPTPGILRFWPSGGQNCPNYPFQSSNVPIFPLTLNTLSAPVAQGINTYLVSVFQQPFNLFSQTACANCAISTDFAGLPDTICMGNSVILRESGSGGYTFQWRVNGQMVSLADSLVFTPIITGQSSISLRTTTPDGFCADSVIYFVWVKPAPQSGFTLQQMDPMVEVADNLWLADSVHYDWGDGTPPGTLHNSAHIYPISTGGSTYTIIQTVYYPCGTASDTMSVTLECPALVAKITGGCCKNKGKFRDMTQSPCPYTVEWDFGDGSTSTDLYPTHTYAVPESVVSLFQVRMVADNGDMRDTTYLDVHTGGSYEVITWPPAKSPIIPLSWEKPNYAFIGDANGNKIEDTLDNIMQGSLVDVVVAVRNCYHNVAVAISSGGYAYTLSDHLGVILVADIDSIGIAQVAQLSDVAMIFHDFPQQVVFPSNGPLVDSINLGLGGNYLGVMDSFPEANGVGVGIGILGQGVREGQFPQLGVDKVGRIYNAVRDSISNPSSIHPFTSQIAFIVAGGYDPFDSTLGVAQSARLVDIRVVDEAGFTRRSYWIRAIDFAIDSSFVQVLLAPITLPGVTDGTDPVSEAVNMAILHQIITVVAATGQGGVMGAPALASEALTVGACNVGGQPYTGNLPGNIQHKKPDLLAIGVGMRSAIGAGGNITFHRNSGASYAAAFAAGTLAQIKSVRPDLQPITLKKLVMEHSLDSGPIGWDVNTGRGILQPLTALHFAYKPPSNTVHHLANCLERDDSPCITLMSNTAGPITAGGADIVKVKIRIEPGGVPKGSFLRLFGVRYGLREAYWKLAPDLLLDGLSPGIHELTIPITWPINDPNGLCLEAVIYNPLDRDFRDDRIRTNKTARSGNYGDPYNFNLYVGNPSCSCGNLLANLRDTLGECWRVTFDTSGIAFCNGACPTNIPVTIQLDTACCNMKARDTTLYKNPCDCGCCDTLTIFRFKGHRIDSLGEGCCYSYENGANFQVNTDSATIPKVAPSINFTQLTNDTLQFTAQNNGNQLFFKSSWIIDGKNYIGNTVKDTFWSPGSPPDTIHCKLIMCGLCNCDTAWLCIPPDSMMNIEGPAIVQSIPKVFPNPTTDHFQVDFGEGRVGEWKLEWTDASGNILQRWNYMKQGNEPITVSWSIPAMPSGMYLLRIIWKDEEWTEKMIIQKGK